MASKYLPKFLFGLIWISLFYLIVFDKMVAGYLYDFCSEHRIVAPLALVLTQVIFASLGLPCSPLSVLAGLLWGFNWGIVYSTLATLVASSFTFALGRYAIKKKIKKYFQAGILNKVAHLISNHKWKSSAIAHANPVFPGSSLGFIFGASEISFREFFFGVMIGTVPLQLLTVALGSTANSYLSTQSMSIIAFVLICILIVGYKLLAPKLLKSRNS